MTAPFPGGPLICILAMVFGILLAPTAPAGVDQGSALDFTRSFLQEYPQFRAEGVMTSTLADRPPYRCRVEMTFDKASSVTFAYNTDGSKNIIPYDLLYADHALREIVYNRDRSEKVKDVMVGAPMRTIFNFVWDILREAEEGVGFNSLVFNGLMRIEREDQDKRTIITLRRRLPAIPVQVVQFTFDADQRLKRIEITQNEKDHHRIDIRRFRGIPAKTPE